MVFKFTKVVPDGYTAWFTITVTSSMAGAAAKVSASFDSHSVQLGLDQAASQRKQELAAAADPDSDTIYYMIGEPSDHLQGSSMPVTAYFKTRTR
jgi:uncharacterized membrane protein YdfJ with MMPL/SSD domain